ncbi:MAG: hypothetical protein GY909_02445 [Oligoflexia bacterium]|nr:hypothetical protein [Oligoflexia bacterium]
MRIVIFSVLIAFFTTNLLAATQCVAHRGYSSEYLENSLEALEAAAELGTHAIEFDIQHSADGIPFLMHDKTLRRTVLEKTKGCELDTNVSDLPFKMIRDYCLLKNMEKIPTLEEALVALKESGVTLFIEYKDEPTLVDVQTIQKFFSRSPGLVFIISFNRKYLDKFKYWRNIYPFLKNVKLLKLNRFGTRWKKKYDGVDSYLLTKRMIRRLHKKNKVSAVYTINREKKMKRYIKKNVQYLTTDKPQLCLDLVSQ